jgi:hypothetical protein
LKLQKGRATAEFYGFMENITDINSDAWLSKIKSFFNDMKKDDLDLFGVGFSWSLKGRVTAEFYGFMETYRYQFLMPD